MTVLAQLTEILLIKLIYFCKRKYMLHRRCTLCIEYMKMSGTLCRGMWNQNNLKYKNKAFSNC